LAVPRRSPDGGFYVGATLSPNGGDVMYWEPAKYVARLRTLKTDSNPLLLKVKMDPAGHGGASGRYDRLRGTALRRIN